MTSSFIKKGIFLSILALSLSAAQAQDPFDAHVADIVVLQPKSVQDDLGITVKQRDQLTKYADAHAAKVHAFFAAEQKKGVNTLKITPSDPTIASYYEVLKTNILSVLTPTQLRRLRQITLQARGYPMLLDPVVGVKLGVTGPERERIKAAIDQYAVSARQAAQDAYKKLSAEYRNVKPKDKADEMRLENEFKSKMGAYSGPTIGAAHRLMDAQVTSVLTAAQRAQWKSLLGKPIKAN